MPVNVGLKVVERDQANIHRWKPVLQIGIKLSASISQPLISNQKA
jgi:hypothetical protein